MLTLTFTFVKKKKLFPRTLINSLINNGDAQSNMKYLAQGKLHLFGNLSCKYTCSCTC